MDYAFSHYLVNGETAASPNIQVLVDRDLEVVAVYQEQGALPPPNPLAIATAAGTFLYILLSK